MTATDVQENTKPALDLKFISHGTLECSDIERTRKFYEEFLGFECVRASNVSLWCRLHNSAHIYVLVQIPSHDSEMPFTNHNGLDVATDEEVNEAHKIVTAEAEKWGIYKITEPREQHGSYCFYFHDHDGNCWEILSNPNGGYGWMFERGDQEGRGHMAKGYDRPKLES